MATNSSTDAAPVSNKIIVSGIPANISSDKLTIYFQRRKIVGGGDVHSITFPVSNDQKDTAIIIFEDPETVQSVLRNTHKIGGTSVTVRQLQSEPQIFAGASAKLSDHMVRKLSENGGDLEARFDDLMNCTGAVIKSKGQDYIVKGEWYQIQALFAKLETLILGNADGRSSNPKSSYISRSLMKPSTPLVPAAAPRQTPRPQEVVSITLDKDMFAYMQMNHGDDITAIKVGYRVDFQATEIGDATRIVITPKDNDTASKKARDKLKALYDEVNASVGQDVVETSIPLDKLEKIFEELRPEFPKVHMTRMISNPNHVMFTAPNAQKCKMIVDIFRSYLSRAENSSKPVSDEASEKPPMISVDKDIVGYMELTRRSAMDRIWSAHGAKIKKETIIDCLNIRLLKNPDSKLPFDPDGAISEFQDLYDYTCKNIVQINYDTNQLKGKMSSRKRSDAIRMAGETYSDVYISPMVGDNSHLILIIASDNAKCDKAHKLVDRMLNAYAN